MAKIKVYNQLTQTECGLCCAAMIASYYSFCVPLSYYRKKLDIGRDGTSLKDIIKLFNEININAQVLKSTVYNIDEKKLPIIVYMANGHFIVVEKIKNDFVYVIDPEKGKCKVNLKEFSENFTGYYIITNPNKYFKPINIKNSVWENYIEVLKNSKLQLLKVLTLSILLYIVTMAIPFFIQYIVDKDLSYIYMNRFIILIISFMMMLIYLVCSLAKNKQVIKLSLSIDEHLTMKITKHLLKLPYSFFERRGSAEIIFRYNLLPNIRDLLTNGIIDAIINIGLVSFILVYMFYINQYLCTILLIILLLIFIYNKYVNKIILEKNQKELDYNAKFNNIKVETLMEIFSIKTMGLEENILNSFSDIFKKSLKAYSDRISLTKINASVLSVIQTFLPFLILVITISLISSSMNFSLGTLLSVYTLSGMLFTNSINLFQNYSGFFLMKNMLLRLNDILTEEEEKNQGEKIISQFESIKFDQVDYAYSKSSNNVINNLCFEIKKGETVAFVGASGSGKSTIMKLLCCLEKPCKGNIYINNENINTIDKQSLKHIIGVVPQNNSLFNKSILDNIKLNAEVTDQQIDNALSIAELKNEIDKMPMKLNTLISEFGMNISGGQKQRIAIARAILHKPQLLILDEATSSLDTVTEFKINNNLSKLNCTKIIIAHRLSTIKDADKIIVLDKGTISEVGTHDSLMKIKGQYYLLYKQQEQEKKNAN